MNIKTIKNLAMTVALALTSASSFAGTGASGSPYIICGASSYKLTASATITSGSVSSYQWYTVSGTTETAISGETAAALTQAPTTITDVTEKHFRVKAKSGADCWSDPQDIYVTLVPAPVFTTNTPAAFCAQNTGGTANTIDLTGTLTATSTALPSAVVLAWGDWATTSTTGSSVGSTTKTTTAATATVTGTAAGTYSYTLAASYTGLDLMNTTGTTCSSTTATVDITVNPLPTFSAGATLSAN